MNRKRFNELIRLPAFERDIRKMVKKFRTIEDDLDVFIGTCRSLKGKGVHSGIRVIYAYYREMDRIELIEIYYKGDKEDEDSVRIRKLC